MLCSKCGAENPTEARFCGKCGTAIIKSPPVVSVPPMPDNPQPRIPGSKKSRLTFPLILIAGLFLVVGALTVVFMVVSPQKNHSPTDDNGRAMPDQTDAAATTLPPLEPPPTPSKSDGYANMPANAAQQPADFTAVSDALYMRKIVGTWTVKKTWTTGAIIETRAVYSADGYATWTGTITYFGIVSNFKVEVAWGVKNGICYCRVESSNIPLFMPVGYTTQSKILSLTDDQWTYVDGLDGQTETSIRVVPYRNAR